MLSPIANLCLVLSLFLGGCSGNELGQTDLVQSVSFPDVSLCEGGVLLRATVADLVRRVSEMENTVGPREALIARLVDQVSTLEEQLTQERAIWAVLEGRVNATAEQGDLAARLMTGVCSATPKLGRLFQVHSPAGVYKYDLDEARHACAEQGASLASYHHLYEAWQDGMEHCACGWLSDGTARYPMQTAMTGCGSRIGIITCSYTSNNAWCFRQLNICD